MYAWLVKTNKVNTYDVLLCPDSKVVVWAEVITLPTSDCCCQLVSEFSILPTCNFHHCKRCVVRKPSHILWIFQIILFYKIWRISFKKYQLAGVTAKKDISQWWLTEICRIMVWWTLQAHSCQERYEPMDGSSVDALSFCQGVQVVKLLKELGRGLVDGADDGATTLG